MRGWSGAKGGEGVREKMERIRRKKKELVEEEKG